MPLDTARKSFDAKGRQWAWDATSLETASACLRKYYYMMQANIRPASSSVHLLFGGAYAAALERFYLLRAEGLSVEDALRDIVRFALVKTYEYDADGNPKQPVPFLDNNKSRLSLIRSLVWYVDQFAVEDDDGIKTYHLADGKPAVELSFMVEFDGDIAWCGHLDRVVEYGGSLYWMDQKTTSQALGPYYFDGYRPHNQFMGYTWAGQVVLQSPVAGGIVDAAQIGVNFTRFMRQPITYAAAQLEEWRENALYHIAAARTAAESGRFPMNLASCGNYGGCPYRRLCAKSPSVREQFILGDYVHPEQPWDPAVPR